jgi:hypothetical protein
MFSASFHRSPAACPCSLLPALAACCEPRRGKPIAELASCTSTFLTCCPGALTFELGRRVAASTGTREPLDQLDCSQPDPAQTRSMQGATTLVDEAASPCPAYCVSCRRATPEVWKAKECGISWARRLKFEEGTSLGDDRLALVQATLQQVHGHIRDLVLPAAHTTVSRPSSAVPSGRRSVRTGMPSDKGGSNRREPVSWLLVVIVRVGERQGSGTPWKARAKSQARLGLHHRTHPGTPGTPVSSTLVRPSTTLTVNPRRPLPSSHCLCVLIVPTCSRPRAHDLCFGYSHFQICPVYQVRCIAGVLSWYFVFSVRKVAPTLASLPRNHHGSLVWARTNSICASPRHLCLPCS